MQLPESIVCPVCFAPLQLAALQATCSGCGRSYPIVDGLPVLQPDRATVPASLAQ